MAEYKIGILNGDDIGLEIVPGCRRGAENGGETLSGDSDRMGASCRSGIRPSWSTGTTLLPEVRERLYTLDGWILGPIGHMAYPKDQPNCFNPHPILRREYDLVSNIRPAKSYAEIPCINPNVDLVIIRENNEGFQPDRNMFRGTSDCMPTPDMALSLRVITETEQHAGGKGGL